MSESKYPEHDKLKEISDLSHAIGDFVDWLGERGIHLASYDRHDRLYTVDTPITDLLAEHFDIDLKALDAEKQMILDELRGINYG